MAHAQRAGIPGAPRLAESRADLAGSDSGNFLELSKNLASSGGWKESEKKPNWLVESSAIRQRSKLAPKVDDSSGTFQDKAQLRVERAEDCFLGESKGVRKQSTQKRFFTVQNAPSYFPRRDSGPICDVTVQPVTTVDPIRDRSKWGRSTSRGSSCVFFGQ